MSDHKLSIKILTYSYNVLETKTYFLKFNFLIFLSDVGGSMGLWLGIGLLQALEIILNFVLNIIKGKYEKGNCSHESRDTRVSGHYGSFEILAPCRASWQYVFVEV